MIFAQANAIEHFFESVEFQTLLIVKIYFSKTLFYLPHFIQSMPNLLYSQLGQKKSGGVVW